MDGFAAAGYLTLGPDYFRGDGVGKYKEGYASFRDNPDFDFDSWKAKHSSFCQTFVPEFVKEVQTTYGKSGTKFGCVGYWYVPS